MKESTGATLVLFALTFSVILVNGDEQYISYLDFNYSNCKLPTPNPWGRRCSSPPAQSPKTDTSPPPLRLSPRPRSPPKRSHPPTPPLSFLPPPPKESQPPPVYSLTPPKESQPPPVYSLTPPKESQPPPETSNPPKQAPPAPLSFLPSPPKDSMPPKPSHTPTSLAQSPPSPSTLLNLPDEDPKPTNHKSIGVVVGAVIGAVFVIIIFTVALQFFLRMRTRKSIDESPEQVTDEFHPSPHQDSLELHDRFVASSNHNHSFSYDELFQATNGFSSDNFLGQGGFGLVHKGVLPNGTPVAVKKLKVDSHQGDREFRAEVDIISRVHHNHVVALVGYCILEDQKLLAYEFVPNKTLEFHLHGVILEWSARMKIAIAIAKGLAYLHGDCHPKIIHRDIKAANILIDNNYEAKVADFGLAKFNFEISSHISTRIVGTIGYLAPEYASSGQVTEKADVYSFGVILVELITGLRPLDKSCLSEHDSIVAWATPLLLEALKVGVYDVIVDRRLQGKYDRIELSKMVSCAVACIRHTARLRPQISQVVRVLEGEVLVKDLSRGIKPGHSVVFSLPAS